MVNIRTKLSEKQNNPRAIKPGRNIRNLEGWRARLQKAAGDMTFRQVAERTGIGMAHTTVRSVFLGPGGTGIDTLAVICDAVGVSLVDILGGEHKLTALPPPGGAVPLGAEVAIVPIVDIADAHNWQAVASDPAAYESMYYTDTKAADGLMAARVSDNSMSPDYRIGDTITFRRGKPKNGDDVLVLLGSQKSSIMRRWRQTADGKRVTLAALNEDFGTQSVSSDIVKIIGIVEGKARNM